MDDLMNISQGGQQPQPEPDPRQVEDQQYRQIYATMEAAQYFLFQRIGEQIFLNKDNRMADARIADLERLLMRGIQSIDAVRRANRRLTVDEQRSRLQRQVEQLQRQMDALDGDGDIPDEMEDTPDSLSQSEADSMRAEMEEFLRGLPTAPEQDTNNN